MTRLPKSIERAIEEFSKLPGIGPKTAGRLTFYLLSQPETGPRQLGEAIASLKKNLKQCPICFNYADQIPCLICDDSSRSERLIMVVEDPLDVVALDRTDYLGRYHVLGGVISPIDGIGPDDLRIAQLIKRLIELSKSVQPIELILATDPSLEGEATVQYIIERIEQGKRSGRISDKLKVSRLAQGLPVGGDLEYADQVTLKRALEGRQRVI